ncbi:MAG: class I SAM-dependent methyltransferase [Candidatus Sumerlaeaceae bacterium]
MYQKLIREFCRRVSPLTQKLGFVLSPVHFYFPIPDTRDLAARNVWDQRTTLSGISWNPDAQLALVNELSAFGRECDWTSTADAPAGRYSSDNPTFGFASAMLAHAMVRHFRPRRIIEVGVGWSTLALLEAAARNTAVGAPALQYTGIDPYPPVWLPPGATEHLHQVQVQSIPVAHLTDLDRNDILFIDSSHVLNVGSDVQYLYLEVLPRLRPGVIVHVHDIQLPREYPRDYAIRQRWFWNEQYLLQAFLAHNDDFEILLAGHYLCSDHAPALQVAFPHYAPQHYSPTGSFWMRRRIKPVAFHDPTLQQHT